MATETLDAGKSTYDNELKDWVDRKRAAISLMHAIGKLMYEKSVELVLFRNPLLDTNISEILNLHVYAREVVNRPIEVYDSAELAELLLTFDLAPAKIDIGRLANEWLTEKAQFASKEEFLRSKLANFIGHQTSSDIEPKDVVLYGFGRIGRLAARELIKQAGKGQQLRLRAIVTRDRDKSMISKRAALLRNDSVHGEFHGTVVEDLNNEQLIINGQIVQMICADQPEDVDYTAYGIDKALVIDNTGKFADAESLGRHLKAKGVSKVLLTAPGKEMPNIVYGINHKELDIDNTQLFSAASCTTNAICPVLNVIEEKIGIEKGHIETVHAYTNDQNLLDNMHKKTRRGRSAAINMVITETGAGRAVTKVIPQLKDKLTANAVRVPTPNGSLAIMHLSVNRETSLEEVNGYLRDAALRGDLVNQINYSIDEELVSSDIIGNTCCSVYDSPATIVSPDKKNIVLYVWYDNEFGYTKQVLRLAKHIAKVQRLVYY
ncbi:MAG: glyceraldehyde-3-phosphate dehydrogenase [Cryomorphaceae bacterium]|nr:MAG: glyceraldehyde-3-phosphate dehydrogenase [Cryomorphaceae bacterium]